MSEIDDWEEDFEEAEISAKVVPPNATDKAIEKHFESGRLKVVQDRNDFFLSHVVDFIVDRKWGNLRPEYQRRLRWDNHKKSKLIESFIMNVPVPPVFLYQKEIGAFEVMDGQQRLNTIVEFLQGKFELTGLKIWPSLNGRNGVNLPPLIKRGLESAKISAITLMSDTSMSQADNMDLRAQVFERLNTGGEQLNAQELRNSLYSGPFNKTLLDLAAERQFTDAWGIPAHAEHILSDKMPSSDLRENNLYKRMNDVEIVLRFFAFIDPEKISGSVRSMLDNAMKQNRNLHGDRLDELKSHFLNSLSLVVAVFGKDAFRLPAMKDQRQGNPSKPLFDAEMIAFHRLRDRAGEILLHKVDVKSAVMRLANPESKTYDLMVGRGNTATTIKERIDVVEGAIAGAL